MLYMINMFYKLACSASNLKNDVLEYVSNRMTFEICDELS